MRYLVFQILFLFALRPIYSAPPLPTTFSGTRASFEDGSLLLSGKIEIDHAIGTLFAESAEMHSSTKEQGPLPFSSISLKNSVRIELKDGGKLTCEKATIDCKTLHCHLLAGQGDLITLIQTIPEKNGTKTPFQLLSQTASLSFDRGEKGHRLDKFICKGQVLLLSEPFFKIEGDRALYIDGKSLTVERETPLSRCSVFYKESHFEAEMVGLASGLFAFKHPRGTLCAPWRFAANKMVWNKNRSSFTLQGHVILERPDFGTLTADLLLLKEDMDGEIASIETKSLTKIYLADEKAQMTAPGGIKFDKKQSQIHARGVEGEQICLKGGNFGMLANLSTIECDTGSLQPLSISMKGDVKLFSLGNEDWLALAGRAHYSPSTKTLILSGSPGNEVIYINENQDSQLAAEEIHLTHEKGGGLRVKGVGKVKLLLSSEELAQIKAQFPKIAGEINYEHKTNTSSRCTRPVEIL